MSCSRRINATAAAGILPAARGVCATALRGAAFVALCTAPAYALDADPDRLSPSFDACYEVLDGKDAYVTALNAEGWLDAADRAAAVNRLSDALLPINATAAQTWAEIVTYRETAAAADIERLTRGRAVLEQEGATLLLAGYRDDANRLLIECAIALADDRLTNDFFATEEIDFEEGVRMTSFHESDRPDGTEATIFVVQLAPESEPTPPLAASDAVLTRLVIPAPSN